MLIILSYEVRQVSIMCVLCVFYALLVASPNRSGVSPSTNSNEPTTPRSRDVAPRDVVFTHEEVHLRPKSTTTQATPSATHEALQQDDGAASSR